jgi:hypothetical protein
MASSNNVIIRDPDVLEVSPFFAGHGFLSKLCSITWKAGKPWTSCSRIFPP